MQETVLRQLVKIAGLEEMTIWRNRHHAWHLSVTVPQRPHQLYLSTRRAPKVPRAFTRLEAALAAGQRLRATRQVTLVLWLFPNGGTQTLTRILPSVGV